MTQRDENLDKNFEIPEDSRIIIKGSKVTIENLTPDLLELALTLNPQDKDLLERAAQAQCSAKEDEHAL